MSPNSLEDDRSTLHIPHRRDLIADRFVKIKKRSTLTHCTSSHSWLACSECGSYRVSNTQLGQFVPGNDRRGCEINLHQSDDIEGQATLRVTASDTVIIFFVIGASAPRLEVLPVKAEDAPIV